MLSHNIYLPCWISHLFIFRMDSQICLRNIAPSSLSWKAIYTEQTVPTSMSTYTPTFFSFLFFSPEHLFWIQCYWAPPIAKITHQHNLNFTLILSASLQACYMSVSCYTVLWGNTVLHCSALEGQFALSRQSVSSPGCAVLSGVSWAVSEALLEK